MYSDINKCKYNVGNTYIYGYNMCIYLCTHRQTCTAIHMTATHCNTLQLWIRHGRCIYVCIQHIHEFKHTHTDIYCNTHIYIHETYAMYIYIYMNTTYVCIYTQTYTAMYMTINTTIYDVYTYIYNIYSR